MQSRICCFFLLFLSWPGISASESVELLLVGSLKTNKSLTVVAEVEGVVESWGFDRGEQTQIDQSLLQIKDDDYRIQHDESKAAQAQARADLSAKKARYERYRRLVDTHSLARDELDSAEADYLKSEAQLRLQALAVEQAHLNLERTRISAKAGYWVAERLIEQGDWVQKGQALYHLEQMDTLRAVVYVTEEELHRIRPDDHSVITTLSLPGESFAGTVLRAGIKPDASTHSYPVEILVENPDRRLVAGFTIDARIVQE